MNDLDQTLRRLLNLARQAPPPAPGDPAPPFLARQLVRQWQQGTPPRPVPWRGPGIARAAVAAVLIVSLGLILIIEREPRQETKAPAAAPSRAGAELREWALLVAEPPVVAVHDPQSAWLSVLTEIARTRLEMNPSI